MGAILKEILEPLEQNTSDHSMLMETSSINTFRNSRAGECCWGFGAVYVRAQTFSVRVLEAECCALLKESRGLQPCYVHWVMLSCFPAPFSGQEPQLLHVQPGFCSPAFSQRMRHIA